MGKFKKVLLLGNENTGKSCILKRFAEDYCESTPYEDFTGHMVVDDKNIELKLSEAPCQEYYFQIRTLCYEDTNVILIVFSVVDPNSLKCVKQQWIKEVKCYCSKVPPIILVGNKKDLRNDPQIIQELAEMNCEPIKTEEGLAVAKEIGAHGYEECSAKENVGVWRAFFMATRAALGRKKKIA